MIYDTIIIGSGVSGYGAALYAGRFELKTLVIGKEPGGVITTTDTVENYPGFKKISGAELALNIKSHAEEYKSVKSIGDTVLTVTKKKDWSFEVVTQGSGKFEAKTIIFATGTTWKTLGVPGERELMSKGVHFCALCDGFFYKEKSVALVGGGDSSAKEAVLLSQWAKKVYMIVRGDTVRAEPINFSRLKQNKKVELLFNTNVLSFHGKDKLEYVTLDKAYKGSAKLEISGAFLAIGHIILSDLASSVGVTLNEKKEIIIDHMSRTNISGVYAAGDVVNTTFKQAITGVAEGVTAAYAVYDDLSHIRKKKE